MREQDKADLKMLGGLLAAILVVAGFMFWGLYNAVARGHAERDRFMTQCMEERKEYECVAMWRTGKTPVPVMLPTPAPR